MSYDFLWSKSMIISLLPCTYMTKSNKIDILRAHHVVGQSRASIEINIGFEILLLDGRALLSINPTPIGYPKFQCSQISILTADLESAEKTVN